MAYGEEKDGKSDNDKLLEEARDYLKQCVDEEESERAKMADDLRFCTLDQWPEEIRKERESDVENGPRPCLTIDKINQYIVQVVNDMRQGKPGINVRPQDDGGDVRTAKILKGLVRNIEDQSNADIPYYVAGESAARIGLGYFRITTEYASEDSFDQDLFIRPIPNTFSVYLGKHIMPDGSDAEHAFVTESIPVAKFKELYPKAKVEQKEFDGLDKNVMGYWRTAETVTVVEYFCIKKRLEELYYLADGTTITKADYDKWPEDLAGPRPEVVERRMRQARQLKWAKMTGVEVLDKRNLPGQWIPIVEVVGREAWVDGRRVVWGLVRPAKDSLRMYNYWASTITERFALEPKQPFIGAKGQFKGVEERWKKANRVNYSYLEYEPTDVGGTPLPPPQRIGPTPMEAALLKQMEVIEHDVQTSLGMFKAAVGETESQQSGRAILALQRESDTGTYHFGANLGQSIRHAGRILVDLIPHYYDTKRIVRILGEDGEVQTATLDPSLEVPYQQAGENVLFNPGMGKYDVSISVGPSYNTKRMEAAATFVELAKGASDPAQAAVMAYLTVRNSDFNGADDAAKMLRALLPLPAAQAISPEGQQMPPAAMAQIGQLTQAVQMLQAENQELQSGAATQKLKVDADHDAKMKAIALQTEEAAAQAKLNEAKAQADHDLAVWKAKKDAELKMLVAEHQAKLTEQQTAFEQESTRKKMAAEQEQREFDNGMKVKAENEKNAASVMPKLEQVLTAMAESMQRMEQMHKEMLAEMKKPKAVSIGGVQRNSSGQVTGASVAVH